MNHLRTDIWLEVQREFMREMEEEREKKESFILVYLATETMKVQNRKEKEKNWGWKTLRMPRCSSDPLSSDKALAGRFMLLSLYKWNVIYSLPHRKKNPLLATELIVLCNVKFFIKCIQRQQAKREGNFLGKAVYTHCLHFFFFFLS